MKDRKWTVERNFEAEGSERSQELGAVLGLMCDVDTLESLIHIKSMLDRQGGWVHIEAYRHAYDTESGLRVRPTKDKTIDFQTDAYVVNYDPHNTIKPWEAEPASPNGDEPVEPAEEKEVVAAQSE